jgi:hypothetical protein
MLLDRFYNIVGRHFPHTKTKLAKVLARTAGELILPSVMPDDFSQESLQEILKTRDREKRDELILKVLRAQGNRREVGQ